jgi:hypothetical protein
VRTQPHKGYSTKAWNPPRNWVSPERIALTLIPAVPHIVTIAKLAGHASPITTSKYDRRGEAAKKWAVGLLNVPYKKRKNR